MLTDLFCFVSRCYLNFFSSDLDDISDDDEDDDDDYEVRKVFLSSVGCLFF